MEQLRRAIATIQKHLGQLTPTQKMLVGSLAVIIAMALFLVSSYAGGPGWVDLLPGTPAAEQQRAMTTLTGSGIRARFESGKLQVAKGSEQAALAQLSETGKLPQDVSSLFRNILERQTWHTSRQQSEQFYNIDLQNVLSTVIRNFSGVKSAFVVLDAPEPGGLGARVRKPTASVTVFTEAGRPLPQPTVDAIANLVAGAKAGLELEHVRIVEGGPNGRQRRASRDNELVAATYLEQASKVEAQMQEKIAGLLAHIPGVSVAVTAQVDVTSVTAQVKRNFDTGQGTVAPLRREVTNKTSQTEASGAAEPGVRSNQTADINRGGGARGTRLETEETETEFEPHVGSRTEQIVDPKGMPTSLVASVNVPRGYVVALLKPGSAAGAADGPSEKEVEEQFKLEQRKIEGSIRPHLRTRSADGRLVDGEVVVSMVPIDVSLSAVPPQEAGLLSGLASLSGGGGSGMSGLLGSGLIDKAILAVLAIVAMGMMVMLVRRSARKVELPTAEELVGVPPTLEANTDLIGEADESETAMAGIEVDEDSVRSQKMLESVGEFVQSSPDQAGQLMRRWISVNE